MHELLHRKTHRQRDPVGPFLHYLMAECGVSPHTLAAYRSDLMRFLRWRKSTAPVELAKLDAITLGDYVDSLNRAAAFAKQHLPASGEPLDVFPLPGPRRASVSDNVAKLLIAPAVWDRLPTVLSPAAARAAARIPEHRRRGWAAAIARCSKRCTPPAAAPPRWSGFGRWIWISTRERPGASARGTRNGRSRWARARSRRISVYLEPGPAGARCPQAGDRDGVRGQIGPAAVADCALAIVKRHARQPA